jgi:hypothetical protein
MRRRSMKFTLAAAGLALLLAPHTAFAAHNKAGLWQITVRTDAVNANMPDMSKLPPDVQARMKAMGIGVNGNAISMQVCRTAAEGTQDVPPWSGRNKNCTYSHTGFAGGTMDADMTCTGGDFTGTGHVHFVMDSDEHFAGDVEMTGTEHGHQVSHKESIEGRWLSAPCTSTAH